MSRTPAAELARLKLAFPDWTIRRLAASGFSARRKLPGGDRQLARGRTLADLEYQLRMVEKRD